MAPPAAELPRNNLWLRVASAAVLTPVVLALVYVGGWPFATGLAFAAVAMSHEWERLTGGGGQLVAVGLELVAILAIVLTMLGLVGWAVLLAGAGAMALAMLARWLGRPAGWPALGAIWLTLPCVALTWLRVAGDDGLQLVLGLLLAVWACDTAAYFTGRALGGPRLAPRWSPSKTWAGLIGGVAGAALVGAGWSYATGLAPPQLAALAGAMLAVVAQCGDIAESVVKRRFGVKDSGRMIPGHGGILDRVDGLLFAAPAAAVLMLLGGRNLA
jgi:phosphatidate cytidylyltransferase